MLKTSFIAAAIIFTTVFSTKAQLGYNYSTLDFGISGIANQVYGDAEPSRITPSGSVSLNYNATPFVNYIVELQAGQLRGGDSVATLSGRQFTNNYVAGVLRGQLQAGELIDYSGSKLLDIVKNVYVSTGIGIVNNNIKNISRVSEQLPGYYTDGKDRSTEIFIPARIGYELKIFDKFNMPSLKVDLAYQMNIMMGDNLDGFAAGKRKDWWSQISLGIKFAIGNSISYRKPIYSY